MSESKDGGCGCLILILLLVGAAVGGVLYQANTKARDEEHAALRAADLASQHMRELLDGKRSTAPGASEPQELFWPAGEAQYAGEGYMVSDKFIPLRAISRRPNASLYSSEKLEYPAGVVGIMKVWQPYYVFKRTKVISKGEKQEEKRAILIGADPRSPEADRKWVNEDDCFCWTTRECINIETPVPIYPTREAAEKGTTPRDTAYTFSYGSNFESGETGRKEQSFRMSSLPVLRREDGGYWCFVRPEGTEQGYQVCWVKWNGEDPAIKCRIRSSRHEFEEYMSGVRQLMIDYRTPEKENAAKQELYEKALKNLTHDAAAQTKSLSMIKSRQQGIPKLTGFLELPIESPLQYENVTQRVVRLLELSERDIWDINEIAYIQAEQLP